jgi:hypothetical protein
LVFFLIFTFPFFFLTFTLVVSVCILAGMAANTGPMQMDARAITQRNFFMFLPGLLDVNTKFNKHAPALTGACNSYLGNFFTMVVSFFFLVESRFDFFFLVVSCCVEDLTVGAVLCA